MKSPGEYEGERQRFVSDTVNLIMGKPKVDKMMFDFDTLINSVLSSVKPIQQAGGAIKRDDVRALRDLVFKLVKERFDNWHRDELCMIATTLTSELLMQKINQDPWAGGTPDALSS